MTEFRIFGNDKTLPEGGNDNAYRNYYRNLKKKVKTQATGKGDRHVACLLTNQGKIKDKEKKMNGKATFRKNGGSAMKNTYERLNNGKSTFLPLPDLPKIPLPL
ncbi:MAG: hypothetical protein IJ523_11285, partial [Succinivibrionaceae bacterium]|nr:hypothetical protein [Succinivibrionaceae bacterium]